jgi:tRNA threonylcarbamoyladenosine biosynthesis protein TsaB
MALKVRLLAFDTSSSACSAAIYDSTQTLDRQVISLNEVLPMQQGRLILPMIRTLLDRAGLQLNELDAIAYGCGPGSYTGIRIASSVAQGLGFVSKRPVIAVSSLAAIAQTAYEKYQQMAWLVALDARMDEVYWAQYVVNKHKIVELLGKEVACLPEKAELIEKHGCQWGGVGDAWVKYGDKLAHHIGLQPQPVYSEQLPDAKAILSLARFKFVQNDCITASEALPTYLR